MIRLSSRIALTSRRGTASVACTASTNLRRKQLVCLTTARIPPHTAPTSIGHDERSNVRCQPTSCLSTAAATHPHVKANVTEERRGIQQREQRLKTPPVEEESGPSIRDMRAQLRGDSESGSRGSRRVRKGENEIICTCSLGRCLRHEILYAFKQSYTIISLTVETRNNLKSQYRAPFSVPFGDCEALDPPADLLYWAVRNRCLSTLSPSFLVIF